MPLVVTGSGSDLPFLLLILSSSTYLLLERPLGQKRKTSGFLKLSEVLLFEEVAVFYLHMTFLFPPPSPFLKA